LYTGVVYDPKLNDVNRTWTNMVFWNVGGGYYLDNLFEGSGTAPTYATATPQNFTIGVVNNTWETPILGVNTSDSDTSFTIAASISNSILTQISGPALSGSFTSSGYNAFYGNSSIGGSTATGDMTTVNPLTSGLMYLPRIESGSTLAASGSGGGPTGATILWKIGVDHTLYGDPGWNTVRSPANGYGGTADQLWPWPNEALIKADMASYNGPGPVGARGFCTGTSKDGSAQSLTKYIWEYLGNQIPSSIYGDPSAPAAVTGLKLVPIYP
jgi:hypothetical protein